MRALIAVGDPSTPWVDEVVLPFELRSRRRLRCRLESGEEVSLVVPRGTVLRANDVLVSDAGDAVRVRAASEPTLLVEHDAAGLVRCAYHLGNRHVQVALGEGWLRILDDPVLARMLVGLGARVSAEEAPFEPESGAYGHAHSHATEVSDGATPP